MEKLVKELIKQKKTISTMESCTGGGIANAITNVEGSSEIIKFSAVTYSNEFKIKMGVSSEVIDKYTVYSQEVADEMSKNISLFTSSDYGVGVTGQINRVDPNNIVGDSDKIYVSVYDRNNDKFYNETLTAVEGKRKDNKDIIIDVVEQMVLDLLEYENNNSDSKVYVR